MSLPGPEPISPDHSIHQLFMERWSPYLFDSRPVPQELLLSCLEAARWAASSYNEQPWSFLMAQREDEDEFARMLECLLEANQQWAQNAGVLLITVVRRTFTKNGKPNRVAEHDIGLAAANFTLQATALGLHVHQMAGVNLSKSRQIYNIPDGFDPYTGIALGYAANAQQAQDAELAKRDLQRRGRKKLSEFVFSGSWNQRAQVV